jgi:hypothetical protein
LQPRRRPCTSPRPPLVAQMPRLRCRDSDGRSRAGPALESLRPSGVAGLAFPDQANRPLPPGLGRWPLSRLPPEKADCHRTFGGKVSHARQTAGGDVSATRLSGDQDTRGPPRLPRSPNPTSHRSPSALPAILQPRPQSDRAVIVSTSCRRPIHTLHACCLRLGLPLPVRTQDSLRGVWLRPTSAELSSARHHELLLTHPKSGRRSHRYRHSLRVTI